MQSRHGNAIIQGSSVDNLMVRDVVDLIKQDELKTSIPFMAYSRATRRAAEKQAKRLLKHLKK
ncbi:hypothetical protein JOD82_002008 [Paenibacillus sp. 1182]|uniref:hypothetical protein n=1 Tax=Paenibacillus sp. 1182 TaxID=2806565 RepID=UPI001AE57202|nr:hypothetical protein [Paenibacillus sp. 1182]MBP1308988.1 hypothetical protein [Paenibacillus sp. 1182]